MSWVACCIIPPEVILLCRPKFQGKALAAVDGMLELGNKRGYKFPDNDEVVIHLHLGDAIELSNDEVGSMLHHGGNPAHCSLFTDGIKSIVEYLDTLEKTSLSRSTFVGDPMCSSTTKRALCMPCA